MLARVRLCAALLFAITPVASGGPASGTAPAPADPRALLGEGRLFFGHQSVGRDLLAGMAALDPAWRAVASSRPDTLPPGSFAEAPLGANGDPASKDRAFAQIVRRMRPGDVAFYKYCFADFRADTDVAARLEAYVATISSAREHGVLALPVTVPLTRIGPTWKRMLQFLMRRASELELDARRTDFNRRLRERFRDGTLVDLARHESIDREGHHLVRGYRGRPVEVLVAAFTDDGAHLNETGRRIVGARFLENLRQAIAAARETASR